MIIQYELEHEAFGFLVANLHQIHVRQSTQWKAGRKLNRNERAVVERLISRTFNVPISMLRRIFTLHAVAIFHDSRPTSIYLTALQPSQFANPPLDLTKKKRTYTTKMSRDSSATYLHLSSSRLADVFEEFCRPPSSTVFASTSSGTTTTANNANNANANTQPAAQHQGGNATTTATGAAGAGGQGGGTLSDGSGMTALPGYYLPFEEITLPAHLMPLNPEDEDDVVPDMHAAFGINRALNHPTTGGGVGDHNTAATVAAAGETTGEISHAGVTREAVWRDLGLEGFMAESGRRRGGGGEAEGVGRRREGKRTGLLLLR